MIEAVNSVVANAALLRGNADQAQQDRLNTLASSAKTESVQMALAPFVSPYIQIDTNFNKAVLQVRDSDTGDVLNQFPSETMMRARAAQAEIATQRIVVDTPSESEGVSSAPVETVSRDSAPVQVQASAPQPRVAEAQIASSVLSAGAMSGGSSFASISVFA